MQKIGAIIAKYRKKEKLSQPELAALLTKCGHSISYKSVSSWETGKSEPSISSFLFMCKILHITDPYAEFFGENPGNTISYLNEEGKTKALDYIELLNSSEKYKKEATVLPFTRLIKLFDLPASAGTGNFIDSDKYTEIEVGAEIPEDTDFGIRLSGDSMMPQFINNQIVWVQQQESLDNGEIGIFALNGDAYCKRLQNDEKGLYLISLNEKYNPIPVTKEDSFKIFGKVLG